jgi:hypothetical protein
LWNAQEAMSKPLHVTLAIALLATLGAFFVPLNMGLFDVSLYDFMTGALSGGEWSWFRVMLTVLFGVNIVGVIWSCTRIARARAA